MQRQIRCVYAFDKAQDFLRRGTHITFIAIDRLDADRDSRSGGVFGNLCPYLTKCIFFFLCSLFAALPIIATKFMGLPQSIQIGGTSLLIVIGVAIETMKTLEAQVTQKEYKGFGGR